MFVGVKVAVGGTAVFVGVKVAVGGIAVFVAVKVAVGGTAVFVGVLVGPVATVPPPKSSITAFAALMNHSPIYPPLVAYVQPLASRVPIKAPFW